jgi:glycosyltransferase involved in cell wall biosynthesis
VHLTAPSRFLRDRAVAAGIVPPGRAHVLRNAYAPLAGTAPRPASGRILLIADSLAEGRKRMALALEVLAAVAQALPPGRICVDIVGAAPAALRARLAAQGVPHVLHGRIADHARLTGILAQADVVLSCSDEDNWPNVLVEAGSYGALPVVGPGHGCAEFVATYGFGEVAAGYGVEDFARALQRALARAEADPEARHAAALRVRADHAPERVAAGFAALHAAMVPVPA